MQATETKVVEAGHTIEQLVLTNIDPLLKPYAKVFLDGLEIKPKYWKSVIPKEKTVVYIAVVPQGGGGGGGKNPLAVIASIALVVAAPYMAAALLPAGASALAIAATTAAINLVGGLAIQALFPPPPIDTGTLTGGNVTVSPTYSISGTRNQIRKYQPVKRLYGEMRVVPDIAANPYTLNFGDTQVLYMLYDFGLGDIEVTNLKIGQTDLINYRDVSYRVHRNVTNPDLTIYTGDNITTDVGQKLIKDTPVVVTTQDTTSKLFVNLSFPRGQGSFDDSGNLQRSTEIFKLEYREVGATTWNNVFSRPYSLSLPTLQNNKETCASEWVDDGWGGFIDRVRCEITIDTYNATVISDNLNIIKASASPFKCSIEFTPPPSNNRIEVRVTKLSDDSTSTRVLDEQYFESITERLNVNPVSFDRPHTILEMSIKASDQLQGVVDELSAYCRARIDYTYNGIAHNDYTSNPSHIVQHMLRNTRKPLPIERIDLPSFKDYADYCNTLLSFTNNNVVTQFKRSEFNGIIDYQATLKSVVDSVLGNAYGSLTVVDGKYRIITDKPRSTPIQVFTPRNSSNFNGTRNFNSQPHALKIKYASKEDAGELQDIILYTSGYTDANATEIEEVNTFGVTDYRQAYLYGLYLLSQNEFRSESYSLDVDIENLIATRGDKVLVQHDVAMLGGIPARISSINSTLLKLDEFIELDPTKTYQATVRKRDATIATFNISTTVLNGDTINTLIPISGISIGDLIVVGEITKVTDSFQVAAVTPNTDLSATLLLVPYRDDFWSFETTKAYANYVPVISENSVTFALPNIGPNVTTVIARSNGNISIDVTVQWTKSQLFTQYQVYASLEGSDYYVLGSSTTSSVTASFPYSESGKLLDVKVLGTTALGRQISLDQATNALITLPRIDVPSAPGITSINSGTEHLLLNADGTISSRMLVSFNPVADNGFVRGYDLRYKINTETEYLTAFIPFGDNSVYLYPVNDKSTYVIQLRTSMYTGDTSDWSVEYGHTVVGKTEPPSDVPTGTISIKDRNLILNWAEVADLDVYQYEIRKGSTWETAEYIARVNTTQWLQEAAIAGTTTWLIKAIDTSLNYSLNPRNLSITINPPNTPTVSAQVIDNNVLLYFSATEGSLPIEYYEVKRGTTIIGNIRGTFTTVFEQTSGTYTYRVTAVDIAGNRGLTGEFTTQVSQPPDYVLNTTYDSTFNGTATNVLVENGIVTVPVNLTQTWQDYLDTSSAYATLEQEIQAGFLNWLTPHQNTPGSYVEVFDYGTVLSSSLVAITPTIVRKQGAQNVVPTIEVSADGITWVTYNNVWQVYTTNFRYVRFTGTETPLDSKSQTMYSNLNFRLDAKLKNDGFSGMCYAADVNGTVFNFQTQFVDVTSIVATPLNAGEARDVVIDFVDTPYPTEFRVYLFNKSGNRVDGLVSLAIRGY